MKPISGKKLCKLVEKAGWVLKKVTGSHCTYVKPSEKKLLTNSDSWQPRFADRHGSCDHENRRNYGS